MTFGISKTLSALSEKSIIARYEELREIALNHGQRVNNHGLSLFIRRGMVAWMLAWKAFLPPPCEVAWKGQYPAGRQLPGEVQQELVMALVSMALNGRRRNGNG
jgi:hypothetical protein